MYKRGSECPVLEYKGTLRGEDNEIKARPPPKSARDTRSALIRGKWIGDLSDSDTSMTGSDCQ
jgi:hypothetical protein